MKKKVHVIHHTHWDFEWYFTRNEALIQFVYHMDEVFNALRTQKVDYYLLDGQMSILDDYLSAYPEKKSELKKWVSAGRLFIGPWYTQTDELIITGESIVRNLSLGMQFADDLGGSQRIGYLPDSFGQGADMPKIYNQMGIKDAVFWRGLPKSKTPNREFVWESEDGSKVNVANIRDGYFVGVGLIENDDTDNLMTTIIQGSSVDDVVLPVGGDQRYVDYNLKDRIEFYNQRLDNAELIESNYPEYFKELREHQEDLDVIDGEFIDPSVSKIHRSIYSSRYDQKYLNDKVERRMIYQVEPLMAMADRIGIPYKKALLDKIWKLIVRNHAHDSAGGCNSDKTNRMINERLVEADQLSYSLVDYLVRKISESDVSYEKDSLTFFNTLPFISEKEVKFQVSLPQPSFELFDGKTKVDFDVLKITKEYHGQIKRDTSLYKEEDYYYKLDCVAKIAIPALQWKTYKIVESNSKLVELPEKQSNSIEDGFYKIDFQNGKLNLTDLKHDKYINDFLKIEDGGDEGDTYDYSPAHEDKIYQLDFKDAAVKIVNGRISSKMTIRGNWLLPKDLDSRSNNILDTELGYIIEISLNDNGRIDYELKVNNNVQDHRMRVITKTDIHPSGSYADTGFGYIKRPLIDKNLESWREIGYHEEPTSIFPMIHFVNLHDNDLSVSFLSKGIKEYQVIGENYSQLALTLFRSVGFLGRPDLIRRPGVASGNQFAYIPTPDSQLEQELHFKWSTMFEDSFDPAITMKEFQKYAVSLPYYQNQMLNQFTNTLKYFVMHPLEENISSKPYFEIVDERIVFSSLTRSIDGASDLVRVVNLNKEKVIVEDLINFEKEYYISETDFTGKLKSDFGNVKTISNVTFKPGEVKTFKITR